MSSVIVAGNTSGSITLDAPDVAGTTVITLPTASGTMVATDASGNVGIGGVSAGEKLEVVGGIETSGGASSFNRSGLILDYQSGSSTGRIAAGPVAGSTLAFHTANGASISEKMRIDSDGNLGLGVTPSTWLGINGAIELQNGGAIAAAGTYYYNSTNAYYQSVWKYKTSTGGAALYTQSLGTHSWSIAPSGTAGTTATFTQAMTLNAAGGLQTLNTIGVGNATPSTSGAGITFPATQSASTNANTLDDYEEGTFTPTIIGTTTAGTGTYGARTGVYTKIGNILYFYAYINWSAHTGTGNLLLSALPFTSSSTSNLAPVVNIVGSSLTFANQLYANISGSSTQVDLRTMSTGAATAAVAMDTAATIVVTGFYYVA